MRIGYLVMGEECSEMTLPRHVKPTLGVQSNLPQATELIAPIIEIARQERSIALEGGLYNELIETYE